MKLLEVKEILDAQLYACEELLDEDVLSACGCDLMSDVLAFSKDNTMLLTGLMNAQVLRTAEMLDMKAIVFVRGKIPNEDIIKMAKEKEIVVFTTKHPLYTACGLLYSKGLGSNTKVDN